MIIFANILGGIAIIVWSLSIQHNNKKKILIYQTTANIFYTLQYIFLHAPIASIMNFISAIRCIVFYNYENRKGHIPTYIFLIFSIISILIGIFTYQGITSIIPIICTLLYMYSLWQDNINVTRYLFIVAAILLIYHNFQVRAYISVVGNIIEILSAINSTIRYNKNKISLPSK